MSKYHLFNRGKRILFYLQIVDRPRYEGSIDDILSHLQILNFRM
jgi:hypothetical protein